MRQRLSLLALALLLAAFALPALAAEGEHPLMVLDATYTSDGLNASASVRAQCSMCLKNLSDVAVDGVKVTVKLREGTRVILTQDKEVGTLEAGKKTFLDFKFEDYSHRPLKPQIWVTYNGPKGPVTFEAEPPVW